MDSAGLVLQPSAFAMVTHTGVVCRARFARNRVKTGADPETKMSELSALASVKFSMIRLKALISGVILQACLLSPAAAGVAHKWVDADGITHYSDAAPASAVAAVTRINLEVSAPGSRQNGFHSIANQWQRMHRERQQRERLKMEKARLEAAQQPAPRQVVYIDRPAATRHVSAYPGFVQRKHGVHRSQRKFRYRHAAAGRRHNRDHRASLGFFPHVD